VLTGPTGSGPIGVESASAVATPPLRALAESTVISVRFILFPSLSQFRNALT
jgi:hypothetical protein